jgi:hypothetical protein
MVAVTLDLEGNNLRQMLRSVSAVVKRPRQQVTFTMFLILGELRLGKD